MRVLQNMKLSKRMALGFGSVLLLLTAIVSVATIRLNVIDSVTDKLLNDDLVKAEAVKRLDAATRGNGLRTLELLLTTDPQRIRELGQRISKNTTDATEAIDTLEKLVRLPEGKQLLAAVRETRTQYRGSFERVTAELQAGDVEAARSRAQSETIPLLDELQARTRALADLQNRLAQTGGETVRSNVESASYIVIILGLCALGLGVVFAWVLTRSITVPIAQAVHVARQVAAGDLTLEIEAASRDEIGDLLRALKEMNAQLSQVVGSVRGNAESVATASAQIAQGNQDLSQRTEEQASALQQTAASMEQLGSTVHLNAENARQANQLAQGASEVAMQGGEVVGQVVSTMQGIHQSSRRIADIIGTIDGIAFQTNILALNAAVEAARAGEQGRGFAVVAGEVRSLAQRSAEAAREIKSLISASVEQVEQGNALVDRAGATMQDVVASIRRVSDIVGEISSASTEQSTGVGQVGEAVSQMDQVTQQNAALVEESAAAAESLRLQATQLVQVVSVFRLRDAMTLERPQAMPVARRPHTPLASATRLPRPAKSVPAPAPATPDREAATAGAQDWTSF